MEMAIAWVDAAIRDRSRLCIGVVNAAKIVQMQRDPELRGDVLGSDVILADGMSVVWASRFLGAALPERVTGVDLMLRILERGHAAGYRVFLLGARADVVAEVAARIRRELCGVQVVGQQHGYFTETQEPEVAAAIRAAAPDVLFVAMSSPRKERFMARWGAAWPCRSSTAWEEASTSSRAG